MFYNMLRYEYAEYKPIQRVMYEVLKYSTENGYAYVDIGVSQDTKRRIQWPQAWVWSSSKKNLMQRQLWETLFISSCDSQKMNPQKKICIAFLGNALHDSRIVNLSNSLKDDDCSMSVISFDWFISSKNYFDDETKIFKLTKGKFSLFFYLHLHLYWSVNYSVQNQISILQKIFTHSLL